MGKSKIEWTDETWNPVTGCTKVSAGCKHCYAEREWPRMTRLVPAYAGRDFTDVRTHADRLEQPLRWKRPRKIFVNSMSDLFHPDVPFEFIDRVFAVMALSKQHVFQVLTKRPDRMRDYVQECCGRVLDNIDRFDRYNPGQVIDGQYATATAIRTGSSWPLPNVWLGVSVENQEAADERIPLLLKTPAAVRFISAEPLLGSISFDGMFANPKNPLDGSNVLDYIDWLIVGGESGTNARPMHPDWVRSLRDQCAAAGVPFLFKQWGEWLPGQNEVYPNFDGRKVAHHQDGSWGPKDIKKDGRDYVTWEPDGMLHHGNMLGKNHNVAAWAQRVGKKSAGRLLDSALHDEYPGDRG